MIGRFRKAIIIGATSLLGLITLSNSAYVVNETEHAIVTRMGEPVKVIINPLKRETPEDEERFAKMIASYKAEGLEVEEGGGLYFKTPFVKSVTRIDRRIKRWDGAPEEISTRDKNYLLVDPTARWYVDNPMQYFRAVKGMEAQAQTRIGNIIDAAAKDAIGNRDLIELVRTDNREMRVAEKELMEGTKIPEVKEGRHKIIGEITAHSQKGCEEIGVRIYKEGVLMKELSYNNTVKEKVEDRMISERDRIAKKYHSEGDGEANKIEGRKEKEMKEILSGAYKTAQKIEGEADREAARIYRESYSKDPGFYEFTQKLNLLEQALPGSKLVLGTDSPLIKYVKGDLKAESQPVEKK